MIDKIDVTFNNTKLESHRITVFCRQLIIIKKEEYFMRTYIVVNNYMPKIRDILDQCDLVTLYLYCW